MIERLRAWCGRPSEDYVTRMICEMLKRAEKKRGKTVTVHFGFRKSASVVFPKE